MSRLIDADKWIEKLNAIISDEEAPGEIKDHAMFLISEISAEPTAFDVSKVVAELEDKKGTYFDGLKCEGTVIRINDAIDIVRKGGIYG